MSGPSQRLLSLLSLLQVQRDWPGHQLADRLEVSARTVRRDVDRLRALGYPVRALKGPDGGYRLDAGTDLPPLLFDDDQAVALTIALQMAVTTTTAVGEAAARALTTVRQLLPPRLRQRVDSISITPLSSTDEVPPASIVILSDAVRAHELIQFRYKEARRRAEPHNLVVRHGHWYLLAWDLDRNDWRTFRVDRMGIRPTVGHRFEPRPIPGGDVGAFLSALFKGSQGTDAWPCMGSATLAVPATELAPYVHDGTLAVVDERHCRLTQGAWSWAGLAALLGRFDAEMTHVEPAALRNAFATLAHRFAHASDVADAVP